MDIKEIELLTKRAKNYFKESNGFLRINKEIKEGKYIIEAVFQMF